MKFMDSSRLKKTPGKQMKELSNEPLNIENFLQIQQWGQEKIYRHKDRRRLPGKMVEYKGF